MPRPADQRRPAGARSSTRCAGAPCRRRASTCSRSAWSGSSAPSTRSSDGVAAGRATFKAVRGEYGSGKTFFARWLAERAKRRGMAAAEVQISETETPLHRLETVYRRLVEQLSTAAYPPSALREIVDAWFYTLEEDVLAEGTVAAGRRRRAGQGRRRAAGAPARRRRPDHARVRRGAARLPARRPSTATRPPPQALLAWLGGQPNVAAAARRAAGVKGDLDHFAALGFLQGLLTILRDSGHPGLAARARRDRDPAAGPLRRARQGPQRAAAARRRRRRRPVPRPVPADHRDARVLRRAAGHLAADAARPAARDRLRHRRAVRLAARRAAPAAPASTCRSWPGSAARSATCTRTARRPQAPDRRASSTTPTSPTWPARSPGNSAARSASHPGCSCASWSPTCSTGSPSSTTSTRASTTS